jgi:hypothetical protein
LWPDECHMGVVHLCLGRFRPGVFVETDIDPVENMPGGRDTYSLVYPAA